MSSRNQRGPTARMPAAPIHRGPQAVAPAPQFTPAAFHHAPNAALLIDFDNVTMGIRSDLATELRNLLGSDIIKGKVAVQRAYADWRRYPQYIVPLAESSIDMIMAPAYGSSKKNATDIRLAVDAMELVFTRPEIGTYILLSGDSDFASLVTKLKEYGKYVIGVGIRESSSDLLVMNCDEYYSYNSLAGLVRTSDEEAVRWDPWELVGEALRRMKRNGDVMRSDRLKQVMQEVDSNFDEKNLGMSKFSRFVQEAAGRGLVKLTRLDNGQLEVDLPDGDAGVHEGRPGRGAETHAAPADRAAPEREEPIAVEREERGERAHAPGGAREGGGREGGRRGRRGRGHAREREELGGRGQPREAPAEPAVAVPTPAEAPGAPAAEAATEDHTGERLTRDEAFDLVRRAVTDLAHGNADVAVRASDVRRRARELLGRDSESLAARFFTRILQDAHVADLIDLRRRGDDYDVALAASAPTLAAQLEPPSPEPATPPASQAGRSAANAASLRRGIRSRGPVGRTGRPEAPPPELLMLGVVDEMPASPAAAPSGRSGAEELVRDTAADISEPNIVPAAEAEAKRRPARGRGRRGGRGAAARGAATDGGAEGAAETAAPEPAAEPAAEPAGGAPARRRGRGRPGGRARAAAVTEAEPVPEPVPAAASEAAPAGARRRRSPRARKKAQTGGQG